MNKNNDFFKDFNWLKKPNMIEKTTYYTSDFTLVVDLEEFHFFLNNSYVEFSLYF